jgi:hypothetical protein
MEENIDASNIPPVAARAAAAVGQKRMKDGAPPRRSTRGPSATAALADPSAVMSLDVPAQAKLCASVNAMLQAHAYVDSWKLGGVARWLQEQGITISEDLLHEYFDLVDQNEVTPLPHVIYDISERTVHRDY